MQKKLKLFGLVALLLALCFATACSTGMLAEREDPLPSWQGPVKAQLLEYVAAVSTPGSKDFIPPQERIASFDMDGTLIAEKPLPFVMDISLVWLKKHCPAYGKEGARQAALCRAAATGDRKEIRRRIGDFLTLPYLDMELDAYQALALQVFEKYRNPLKKKPLKELIYAPQLELMAYLKTKGFQVWLCSGSAICAMQAISAKHLDVPPQRCIGTRFAVEVDEKNGRLSFKLGDIHTGLLNLGKVKAANLKLATVTGPVLAFGNSDGDIWMLKYATDSPRRGLALVLNHDDPREFVYDKPDLLKLAKKRGWTVVSMKKSWRKVFISR
jgi:phosphoserine phosphatase